MTETDTNEWFDLKACLHSIEAALDYPALPPAIAQTARDSLARIRDKQRVLKKINTQLQDIIDRRNRALELIELHAVNRHRGYADDIEMMCRQELRS